MGAITINKLRYNYALKNSNSDSFALSLSFFAINTVIVIVLCQKDFAHFFSFRGGKCHLI